MAEKMFRIVVSSPTMNEKSANQIKHGFDVNKGETTITKLPMGAYVVESYIKMAVEDVKILSTVLNAAGYMVIAQGNANTMSKLAALA